MYFCHLRNKNSIKSNYYSLLIEEGILNTSTKKIKNADNLSVAHCEFFENFLVQQGDPTFIIGWPPMEIAHKPTFENTRIEDGSDWAYALVNWSDESRLTVNGIDERARATRRVDEIYSKKSHRGNQVERGALERSVNNESASIRDVCDLKVSVQRERGRIYFDLTSTLTGSMEQQC
ncbi:hypothetical protein PHYBLDRAFT_70747 [Phycomyces blakesleeanus NRRL 1555(-)]|uniref:Uncharacterized protein n=1 Tax=Phycomyces blakesleeanus (strain ATCC 8743b / DSM 1359 / FGSC 10004 / NBRC 33097 / NRRL 1555) TaxID=763407 RepID=A0A167JB03_PHYB8|nr:hypothetical protein PHYBLDRAFT_70747 [Phycomyces blakesleeanus NRRL 1555(-)]OAD65627.1 hypothetical protein PHYBLDRAFT_70747 [Phycomyces blakesleeanus NRRL 1555(-)]|eukprot:XP_018283667.1 hypothetical protein PHYBLDRAFT_70747 [Phycomyces blakesleeanus NRRL 1555(-)]